MEHKKKRLTVAGVAKILLDHQAITPEQHRQILAQGEAQTERLRSHLHGGYSRRTQPVMDIVTPAEVISSFNLETGGSGRILTEDAITEIIAAAVGIPYVRIDPLKLNLDVVTSHIPRPFALKHLIVPLDEKNGVVTVAVADPGTTEEIESLSTARRITIRQVLASKTDIIKILREFFGFRTSVLAAQAESRTNVDLGNLEQYVRLKGAHEIDSSDTHIVSAVEFLLNYAFDQRASDIHIEPKRDSSLVRFRVDGVLHNIHVIPKILHPPIVSRIKMLSRLDLAEKRRPQDGRIKTANRGKEIELRVSTLPVAFGEKVVIRIFDPDILLQELDRIGFYPREYQLYSAFIRRPNGIMLVTGPTGSGKTTTLYSTLRTLSSPEVNIVTIEDPIEMVMEEFNQVGVQPAIGVTFSTVLRNILRQDPDIVMVGEIRDKETADHAVQAALTGHLVLSTLHTNDAPSSLTRLMDLGIPPFLISSTVIGVIAQRLVRKICPACRTERVLTDEEVRYLRLEPGRSYTVAQGNGCAECRGTGYRGRSGLFEVMDMTDRIREQLSGAVDAAKLAGTARTEGMITLREVAIRKMLEGVTTYEEVVAVTG